ncbi:hypothetical protein FOQG_05006 [Fusarium oxysporum f. sp. raphani 54005]|uniref:Uncharacterized protein n=8 Tax=Fusarium oxysporum TaxID=5507 RepID=W9HCH0_FUSOX|nr:hypothetical protein FOXG_20488 [Fusarium oxysporum f. sp. lycopersici 4287]EWY80258.1 hypothetical protein FOYG_16297 [Fusarium oxysporum NRRL 32931]EWZ49653.1 hypothetical protein FOZG_00513 [Fusarium oxysporum Fo47]EWZ88904.1 hypothetical protein FOWG_08708 [Fusarium oxysporum f. sp. lycopersici MN25]EXA54228.1 hypothetical protein FOVG_01748 [Fusarium oxysporum f. sp. pisi HDV247]EXK46898.1 hypothetical protein FOMG_00508 [Fusarium oxysporum f. sp. melonis 26406]EXK93807.1 hypothetical
MAVCNLNCNLYRIVRPWNLTGSKGSRCDLFSGCALNRAVQSRGRKGSTGPIGLAGSTPFS